MTNEMSVLNYKKIRRDSVPYIWVWVAYYAWVVVFTVWWTAVPGGDVAFTVDYRRIIHTVNMLSSAVYVLFAKRTGFVRGIRIGGTAAVLSVSLFLVAPSPHLKLLAAALMGTSLGCINISILVPFVFVLNNTEKLCAVVMGHVLCNFIPVLIGIHNITLERIVSLGMLMAALCPVALFPIGEMDRDAEDKLITHTNMRHAMVLTLAMSTLGAILFLGAGKAMLNAYTLIQDASIFQWYFLGGIFGSVLYALIFALPSGNVHMAISLPFGCLAVGLLCNAVADRAPGMETAFGILLGVGTSMGMNTVYYVLGIAGKKYNSMRYVRLSILVIGICGGISGALFGNWITAAISAMPFSLVFTLISSVAAILVLVFSSEISQVCFGNLWGGDALLPDVTGLADMTELADVIGMADITGLTDIMKITEQVDELDGLGFTPREKEVCILLLQGLTVRQISAELGLAFATVNGYYRSLYRKLGINSKAELFMRFGARPPSH